MYRYFHGSDRNFIPSGLPSRLVDPTLRVLGEQPQFLRIGEGNHPRNELLRKVYQQPSKDVVRTKVLGEIFPPTKTDPYFNRVDNIVALRKASEELGIPLERTGLRIATYPLRIEGDVADVNLLAKITNKAASNLNQAGRPVLANALTRKAKFFNQPTSYSELAVDGTEGVEAILEAYNKAEPRRTANSQGNRPILTQADGLNANANMKSGSPENIPPDDIEGMRGANRYVDVSQGLETARVIQYPNIYDRLNKGAQPIVTPTIPYSSDIPTTIGDSILSPKVSIETKRPRFIDLGHGVYTRQGEPINAEQKNLLDMGMADLEDRSFILQPQERAMASPLPVKYYFSTNDWAESKGLPIGSILPNPKQSRPTTRLGLQLLGLNAQFGRETITPAVVKGDVLYPSNTTIVQRTAPINRLTDDLSNRVLSGEVDLRNYEPFKSNNIPQYYLDQSNDFVGPIRGVKNNTYGARETKTPWREYYSDPFVYEDKGLDGEVNRLMRAVNEAPAQLENALTQQALANRRAIESTEKLRMLGSQVPVRYGLLPQGEGVVNLAREVRKDRRMAEIDAARATNTIAQLKAAQELMGVEYMVKPKLWGDEVLNDYAQASRTRGAMKDSGYDESYPRYDPFTLWEDSMARDRVKFELSKAIEPRQARPSLTPVFPKPKPTIGELFGFTALTPEGLAKYRDMG